MKNLIFISSFILIGLTAAGQKSVKKDDKTEGQYKSLKDALAEPEKVKILSADRKSGIPDSLTKFPNLESFSVFLYKGDALPADLCKAGQLKRLLIFSETSLPWTDLICSFPSGRDISIAGPMPLQTKDSLEKCYPSGNLKIYIFDYDKKEARARKEKEKVKCGTVEEALKSEMKDKELYLRDRENLKEINRLHEIQDLRKLVILGISDQKMNLTDLSGSTTVRDVTIINGGIITGLNLSVFPNLESLRIYFDHSQAVKTLPFNMGSLKSLQTLEIGEVYFDEAEISKLKGLFPNASIMINHVPIQ